VQVVLADRVTEPLVQPVPDQPAKVEPEAAVAVKVTAVPLLKEYEQVLPQLMPAGLLVTVPEPVPALANVNVYVTGVRLKVAVQLTELLTVMLPLEQAASPDQPAKVEPLAATAERVTTVPLVTLVEQLLPQLMPAGELVTVPLPVPVRVTVTVKFAAGVVAQTSLE
jgi:hypothetical protein